MNDRRACKLEHIGEPLARILHALASRLCDSCAQVNPQGSFAPHSAAGEMPPEPVPGEHAPQAEPEPGYDAASPATVIVPARPEDHAVGPFVRVSEAEAGHRLYSRTGPLAPRRFASQAAGWPRRVPAQS